jgi:hypothetical protein
VIISPAPYKLESYLKLKTSMKTKIISILIFMLFMAAANYAQEAPNVKAARLLNESGAKFTKVAEGIWTVPFGGKQLRDFSVVIAADKELLLMFARVSRQKEFRPATELFRKLLAHNDDFDRVKIGIDKDGDVIVRIDLSMRLVDKKELNESLNQTAAAADEVYASIKPFLNPAK